MAFSSTPDNQDSPSVEPSGGEPVSGAASIKAASDENWLSRLETLQSLAQIVREEKLGELDVRFGGARLKLKAPGAKPARRAPAEALVSDEASDSLESLDDTRNSAPLSAASSAPVADLAFVVSPMVGLFYRAPSPNDPVFVSVGDRVEVGQTLGLIETMKVFNEITSEVEGTVTSIAFENGQLIETGDAIMTIRRA